MLFHKRQFFFAPFIVKPDLFSYISIRFRFFFVCIKLELELFSVLSICVEPIELETDTFFSEGRRGVKLILMVATQTTSHNNKND